MRFYTLWISLFIILLNINMCFAKVINNNEDKVLKPNSLKAGDCIGIVAPASGIEDMDLTPAIEKLKSWGYKVKLSPHLFAQDGYLAGSDEIRAEDLNAMFGDEEVQAILIMRGGYGSNRILHLLNYDLIAKNPKLLIGYSDITALHVALWKNCKLITIHGAMAIDINDYSPNYTDWQLKRGLASTAISDSGEFILPENYKIEVLNEGTATGKIIGGNLSVIASLCGTPYELDGTDCILFIEEVGEDSYAIDRMMWQLWENGLLQKVKGIIVGTLRRCEPIEPTAYDYSVREVFDHYGKMAKVPVLYNFPVGHGSINGFLPLGVKATIVADKNSPKLIISEPYAK